MEFARLTGIGGSPSVSCPALGRPHDRSVSWLTRKELSALVCQVLVTRWATPTNRPRSFLLRVRKHTVRVASFIAQGESVFYHMGMAILEQAHIVI